MEMIILFVAVPFAIAGAGFLLFRGVKLFIGMGEK